jgi:hypothetical protein
MRVRVRGPDPGVMKSAPGLTGAYVEEKPTEGCVPRRLGRVFRTHAGDRIVLMVVITLGASPVCRVGLAVPRSILVI